MKSNLKKERNELLRDALDLKAAELEAVKDSSQEVTHCTAYAQLQSNQIWVSSFYSWINPLDTGNVSFFSFPCGLCSGVTQIIKLKAENFDIFILTSKHMGRKGKSSLPRNSPDINFNFPMVPNQFKFFVHLCAKFHAFLPLRTVRAKYERQPLDYLPILHIHANTEDEPR